MPYAILHYAKRHVFRIATNIEYRMCQMRRFAVLSATAMLFLLLLGTRALAATTDINGRTGTLALLTGEQTITGTSGDNLLITCAQGIILTLDGAAVTSNTGCALTFTGTGNKLILETGTTNSCKSADTYPGISVKAGVELVISGSGTLTATGGIGAAAIGSGSKAKSGTLTISGGTVNATGGYYAAAIGGGSEGTGGGTITISGGTVNAIGGLYSAAIGSGSMGESVPIKISGGTVNATGGGYAAAIGSGVYADNSIISISGGTVNATGSAAGIGGGCYGSGGTISISGGTVNAKGGQYSAGIGGSCANGGTISISGGTVSAKGGQDAAGIGGGYYNGETISISGGTVSAYGGTDGAGIGGGVSGGGGTITISGGEVYASRGSANAQDIGTGSTGTGGTFTLANSAAVFLENDSYIAPTILGAQTHFAPVPFIGNTANGIAVPAAWTTARGAFLKPLPVPVFPPQPQTGDSGRLLFWMALAGFAGAAMLLLRNKPRKRHIS